MFAIVDQIGRIIGVSIDDDAPNGHTAILLPEDFAGDLNDAVVIDGEIVFDPSMKLEYEKGVRKKKVKLEAAILIAGSDWKVTRAKEQFALEVPGETLEEIYAYREAIRRASNRAEDEVDVLTSCESVRAFSWALAEADFEGLAD